jgi:hypothetical protein
MTKSENCYNLKCSGLSWSQVSKIVGVAAKTAPTLAKNHMERNGLPHWNIVTAQHEVLTAAEPPLFEEVDPTIELRRGLAYLADQARAAGSAEREAAFVRALSFLV